MQHPRRMTLPGLILSQILLGSTLTGQVDFIIFTPDSDMNRQIEGQSIYDLGFFQYGEGAEGLTLNPKLPTSWTWLSGRGVASDGRPVEFFFRNGQMFATEVEVCSFRNREYPESFTDRIQSNTFTIGIKHDHEALIFVATEKAREVRLVVAASVFAEQKTIELSLGQNESQIVRIFPLRELYRP